MKFAKDLEQNIVSEWRVKYIDYKGGKEKIKNVVKALKHAQESPAIHSLHINSLFHSRHHSNSHTTGKKPANENVPGSGALGWIRNITGIPTPRPSTGGNPAPTLEIQRAPESMPLWTPNIRETGYGNQEHTQTAVDYGSIHASPETSRWTPRRPPSLRLPEPMQHVSSQGSQGDDDSSMEEEDKKKEDHGIMLGKRKFFTLPKAKASGSVTIAHSYPPIMRRVMPGKVTGELGHSGGNAENLCDEANNEFFLWMEGELAKVDIFYRVKEQEAVRRLEELREQLHIMRDMRLLEIQKARSKNQPSTGNGSDDGVTSLRKTPSWSKPVAAVKGTLVGKVPPVELTKKAGSASSNATTEPSEVSADRGGNSSRMSAAAKTGYARTGMAFRPEHAGQRDYAQSARMPTNDITYSVARKKLKYAMIEYYHGLELLKSYCHHNREGIRKINKKFDKVTGLRTSERFMIEKVNKSYFGSSEVLDKLMRQTEDLFSRYFERGDRKHAVERLRTKERAQTFYGSTFRSGIFLGLALFAGIRGLVIALEPNEDADIELRHNFIRQLWAGFFFPLLFVLLFAATCFIWTKSKINYVFCFEFDTRHSLDPRQFLEIPSFLAFTFCLLFWLNFENFWPKHLDPIYYPLLFLAIAFAIIFNPFPILHHKSRWWFIYAHWRIFLSGLYPIEFRDFLISDIYCSLTYTMGNIALISCLYVGRWNTPAGCDSSHSRLLGYMTCLPSIWRFLQCLRRYRDTRNAFPHLANALKYILTMMFSVALSWWRIDQKDQLQLQALFIALGTVSAVYSSIWDLALDFSLLNPYAPWPLLRNELGFKSPLSYYAVIIMNPIFRFSWIFYVIFKSANHGPGSVSVAIALCEVIRRWVWCIFRMENEHCTNVENFRAYRQTPLPYELAPVSPKLLNTNSMNYSQPLASSGLSTSDILSRNSLNTNSRETTLLPSDPSAVAPTFGPKDTVPTGVRSAVSYSPATYTNATSLNNIPTEPIAEEATTHPDIEMQATRTAGQRHSWNFNFGAQSRPNIFKRYSRDGPQSRALNAVGAAVSTAHTQDFERRKNPEGRMSMRSVRETNSGSEDDDDDDGDEDGDLTEGFYWSDGDSDCEENTVENGKDYGQRRHHNEHHHHHRSTARLSESGHGTGNRNRSGIGDAGKKGK